ncbi:TIGR00341 family protein [Chitinophaga rhizosphaerae]|uniref:TIGR00341 family protein n=1 Tax=Chitinophaga rhizosphaerae TaxID=1864947 RepID=UPI000F7FFA0D|nr:TIGR00341 family protein [Chitinophaga rhizosphaerae]
MEKKATSRWWRAVKITVARRFNLHLDKAAEDDVISSITKNSEFKGANLWTLIFAIFIASIGLNVNSTAVIIGAMLISPLMGPIMGIGLGIGISDFELVKKGARNLVIATLISIAASTLYFALTPLQEAQSELLARTTPSIWDVFIALFGGLAGIVAGTRKEKSNVIPGVAIATALMPPLCTAGYALSAGNGYYFMGAIYLYFINSVFICISTFLIVRFLKFRKVRFADKGYERKISRYILIIITITILPSIYLAFRIVDKSIFVSNAQKFVREQFQFRNTQVVNKSYRYESGGREIDLLLIGYELPANVIDSIRNNLPKYNLGKTTLQIRQGLNAKQEIDFSQIRASILEDMYRNDSARNERLIDNPAARDTFPDLTGEMSALFPGLSYYAASKAVFRHAAANKQDTVTLVITRFSRRPGTADRRKMQQWLTARLRADSLKLVVE